MTNLENLKTQAKEAAQSDFLWGLGMRMPSANQARKVCQILSLDLAYEKRVKAVMRLRELDPQALLEIRDDAADEGEETMVEVRYGAGHYSRIAHKKDKELWDKITRELNIPHWDVIDSKVEKGDIIRQEELPAILFDANRSRGVAFVYPCLGADFRFIIPKKYKDYVGPAINVWPWWPFLFLNETLVSDREGMPTTFYIDGSHVKMPGASYATKPNGEKPELKFFCTAEIFVHTKESLTLARKIGHAYEAETARRRKPAKAVVLKNY